MDPTRWREVERLYHAALEREGNERASFLMHECRTDEALRREVESLLAYRTKAAGFIETPSGRTDQMHRHFQELIAADPRGERPIVASAPSSPAKRPTRVGPYEITGVLGVGGMGEVYRAHDPRLHRDVAIKLLPAAFTTDCERLARFQHEARVLASLNHPHIAHVYGLEESGGVPALVMELVQGTTLADRIAGDPDASIPLREVLTIAWQIADGLDAAHEKGIVHRDLKPGNIALTEGGDVKILDFGVAKSIGNATMMATGTGPATGPGAVIGTPAYMSPEQTRGSAIDKRTDIWAFGCVLYELLTRRQPFTRMTASDSITAVLEHDPDMTIVPAGTPAAVRSLVRHCLEKDPKRRLHDIADARLAIDDVLNRSADATQVGSLIEPTIPRTPMRERVLWMLAGLAITATAGAGVLARVLAGGSPSNATPTVFASIVLPGGMHLTGDDPEARFAESRFAVSPDGRRLALVAADDSGHARLWLRELASTAFRPLPETDGASYPFWSPDSESIAFLAAGKLRKIRASGGTPTTVCDGGFKTGAWSRDLILFTPSGSSALYRVPASGGEPRPVTRLDTASGEVQHSYPALLPDGRHFLYFSVGSRTGGAIDPRGVYVASLDGTEPARLLLPGATHARYANGRMLFLRSGTLMAQQFDMERLELRGDPFPLVERVKVPTAGTTGVTGAFSVSDNGVLVYQTGSATESQPVWFDRAGRQIAALGAPADYGDVALSADGARLAVSVMNPALSTRDLWLYDVASGRGQRFTFAADDFAPVWSPDGQRVLFSSLRKGAVDLYVKDVNGLSGEQHLDADNLGLGRFASDWSRDGRFIMYIGGGRAIGRSDLWVIPMASSHKAQPLLESTFIETHGHFAPQIGWFVYASDETGRLEVYADRFPGRGAKRRVSTTGGGWARWARDGSEIFYLSPDNQLMAAAVRASKDRLDIAAPRPLFAVRPRPPVRLDAYPYDVSPDGRRFLVNTLREDVTSTAITLVLNWTGALTNN